MVVVEVVGMVLVDGGGSFMTALILFKEKREDIASYTFKERDFCLYFFFF